MLLAQALLLFIFTACLASDDQRFRVPSAVPYTYVINQQLDRYGRELVSYATDGDLSSFKNLAGKAPCGRLQSAYPMALMTAVKYDRGNIVGYLLEKVVFEPVLIQEALFMAARMDSARAIRAIIRSGKYDRADLHAAVGISVSKELLARERSDKVKPNPVAASIQSTIRSVSRRGSSVSTSSSPLLTSSSNEESDDYEDIFDYDLLCKGTCNIF